MYATEDRQSIFHLMLALDIAQFMDITGFKQRISRLSGFITDSTQAESMDEIFLLGEIE